MQNFFLVKGIQIQNANAMSSLYTIGFPAMTAWLGAVHAMERKLSESGVRFPAVAVASNKCDVKTHKHKKETRAHICGVGYPLKPKGRQGAAERDSFIQQATCNLNVSLLIKSEGISEKNELVRVEAKLKELLYRMRIAGGDVIDVKDVKAIIVDDDDDERSIVRKLMPGFLVVERRDLLLGGDPCDKLLDAVAMTAHYDDQVWQFEKHSDGWVVPLPVGFKTISGKAKTTNARDSSFDHFLVEPVVTLCEFKMAHRFKRLRDILWEYHVEDGLYLCRNQKLKNS